MVYFIPERVRAAHGLLTKTRPCPWAGFSLAGSGFGRNAEQKSVETTQGL
jgi:hypothetical protein